MRQCDKVFTLIGLFAWNTYIFRWQENVKDSLRHVNRGIFWWNASLGVLYLYFDSFPRQWKQSAEKRRKNDSNPLQFAAKISCAIWLRNGWLARLTCHFFQFFIFVCVCFSIDCYYFMCNFRSDHIIETFKCRSHSTWFSLSFYLPFVTWKCQLSANRSPLLFIGERVSQPLSFSWPLIHIGYLPGP